MQKGTLSPESSYQKKDRAHPSFGMTPTFPKKKVNKQMKKKSEKSVSYQK